MEKPQEKKQQPQKKKKKQCKSAPVLRWVCPYDAEHDTAPHRFSPHLLNCGKKADVRNRELVHCPFNSHHVLEKKHLEQHFPRCVVLIKGIAPPMGGSAVLMCPVPGTKIQCRACWADLSLEQRYCHQCFLVHPQQFSGGKRPPRPSNAGRAGLSGRNWPKTQKLTEVIREYHARQRQAASQPQQGGQPPAPAPSVGCGDLPTLELPELPDSLDARAWYAVIDRIVAQTAHDERERPPPGGVTRAGATPETQPTAPPPGLVPTLPKNQEAATNRVVPPPDTATLRKRSLPDTTSSTAETGTKGENDDGQGEKEDDEEDDAGGVPEERAKRPRVIDVTLTTDTPAFDDAPTTTTTQFWWE